MNLNSLRRVFTLLRHGDEFEKTGGVVDVAKAIQHGASAAGERMTQAGHPLLGLAAAAAPLAGTAYAGKKGYEKVKSKIEEIKYRRALKRQGMA